MAAARGARNILLMGAPGVGKGTYAKRLVELLKLPHVSSGDLVRDAVRQGHGEFAATLAAGRLISDEEMTRMLRKRLSQDDVRHGVLLDGYPRNVAQVALLKSILPVTSVLHITLREDLIIRKATARRMCGTCGRIYNLAHIMEGSVRMPALAPKRDGVCDDCGGALEHRADDKMETVVERLRLYKELTEPVLDVLRKEVPIVNFHLTSGVADMMPKLEELCKAQNWLP